MLCALSASVNAADAQPEPALLEFLAEWERDDDGWMDPLQMMDQPRFDAATDEHEHEYQSAPLYRRQHEEGAYD